MAAGAHRPSQEDPGSIPDATCARSHQSLHLNPVLTQASLPCWLSPLPCSPAVAHLALGAAPFALTAGVVSTPTKADCLAHSWTRAARSEPSPHPSRCESYTSGSECPPWPRSEQLRAALGVEVKGSRAHLQGTQEQGLLGWVQRKEPTAASGL